MRRFSIILLVICYVFTVGYIPKTVTVPVSVSVEELPVESIDISYNGDVRKGEKLNKDDFIVIPSFRWVDENNTSILQGIPLNSEEFSIYPEDMIESRETVRVTYKEKYKDIEIVASIRGRLTIKTDGLQATLTVEAVKQSNDDSLLDSGKDITYLIKSEESEDPVSKNLTIAINQQKDEKENLEILKSYDININRDVAGEAVTSVDKTNEDIYITLRIPSEFVKEGKSYWMAHEHDGVVEILEDMDNDISTITIRTSSFSSYVLYYTDKVEEKPTEISTSVPTLEPVVTSTPTMAPANPTTTPTVIPTLVPTLAPVETSTPIIMPTKTPLPSSVLDPTSTPMLIVIPTDRPNNDSNVDKNTEIEEPYQIPLHIHDHLEVITKATCEKPGYRDITCKICGSHEKKKIEEPLGHIWVIDEQNKEIKKCARCFTELQIYIDRTSEFDNRDSSFLDKDILDEDYSSEKDLSSKDEKQNADDTQKDSEQITIKEDEIYIDGEIVPEITSKPSKEDLPPSNEKENKWTGYICITFSILLLILLILGGLYLSNQRDKNSDNKK